MRANNISIVLTDIDGVLTDGKLMLDPGMEIYKRICFKDLDAAAQFQKQGIKVGIISGENDAFTALINNKMHPDFFYSGCKDKKTVLEKIAKEEGVALSNICYIGDGKYDIEAIKAAGLGVCPSDAISEVKKAADVVLDRKGGEGCLASVGSFIAERETALGETDFDIIKSDLAEHKCLIEEVFGDINLLNSIDAAAEMIKSALKKDGQLLLCGNGGSAADAQHLATELVSRFYYERKALNAEALSVNTSTMTAVGNDYSFNEIFSRQVEAKGKAGDVLLGISTSGESRNVIEAMKAARELNMRTIALVGNRRSTLESMADIVIRVPSDNTPRVQEMHILIGHIICELVEREYAKFKD